ncbi:MAG TPA: BBP7 family outer membrane beta-barrel protein [Gemmataceae bacterium]|nr:BBP7 family outer membrane beta-barrel protein [Gemmataceae bacterium]
MRHGTLYALGLTLALAGMAAAQPERPATPPATSDKASDTPTTDKGVATTLPPASLGSVAQPDDSTTLGMTNLACAPAAGTTDGGHQYWFSAEYLWWKIKDQSLPPLVTTGPATFPVGFLGNPGTVVLFGGSDHDQGTLNGVRLRAGMWLDDCRTIGLEGSFFYLPYQSNRTTFSSAQFPVLTRPFTDINTGSPNSEFAAFPGIATGAISIESKTKFCGLSLLARCPGCVGCDYRLDVVGGGQYLDLREELTITESPRFAPGGPFPALAGTQFVAVDTFKTRNQFVGAVIGLDGTYFMGPWSLNLAASIAVGNNHETIEIQGAQLATTAAGATTIVPGGLLALPGANIGKLTKNEVSVVPQLGVNIGYQLTENIQIFGGYTFLYWTHVVRPGDQIDTVLDVNRIPNFGTAPTATSVRPLVPFNQTDFWVQGVSIGVAFSW